ncbi:elongation factor Ts [Buchnera aphidicola (Aphis helianthi)]|uniref:Elongation factor Ts n=1 Tax=Buchnera aphidicola (Aphis helianthi) TaxID=2315802 RepID=A0A4D6XNH7_9GAMM|nr:translation elongation factor Ts [Buchnera aphidicola]QCI17059.1 elongation factor Ts [Buchnera aphidicola (Aphis helianthi)]
MTTNISAELVKKLRLRTGVGFMECKRALIEENGDIELSIDNLRKSGKLQASKKLQNTTNQGLIFSNIENNTGAMIELNCQTDFVSKDALFIALGKEIISSILSNKIIKIDDIKKHFEEQLTELIIKFDENIKINRFKIIKGNNIFSYIHAGRIGVLVSANNLNQDILKNIAMHIAASKPEYIYPHEVPKSIFEREYNIQLELVKNYKKPTSILQKIVDGRMNKFVNNISLVGQNFIIDPNKTVGEILNENNGSVVSFDRFEIGENIVNEKNID